MNLLMNGILRFKSNPIPTDYNIAIGGSQVHGEGKFSVTKDNSEKME